MAGFLVGPQRRAVPVIYFGEVMKFPKHLLLPAFRMTWWFDFTDNKTIIANNTYLFSVT